MKTKKLLLFAIVLLSITFYSCKQDDKLMTVIVDFEDVSLDSTGYFNGADGSQGFISGACEFKTNFTQYPDFSFWSGFACTSKTDSITSGWSNEFSVMAAKGANDSKQFAIAYDTAIVKVNYINHYFTAKSIMLTNSTYSYKAMLEGTDFGHAFSKTSDNGNGDWFKVKITGYFQSVETTTIDYYLADFRNGKTFISRNWEKVDISALGRVDKLMFTFDSSDKSFGYINNPTYVCIDNIELEYTVELKD